MRTRLALLAVTAVALSAQWVLNGCSTTPGFRGRPTAS